MKDQLEEQIANARLEISAESISMSISELTNLYKEGVLEIRPEFQRLFRWTDEQKSRLVESILLGIPLPSLFVSQEATSGKWELVDGLQRVSTILELQGQLKAADGTQRPPLILSTTKFLPDLAGRSWDGSSGSSLTEAQKLDLRLARLDLKIIKRSSDPKAKFDLFQRLNSYGSALEPQEIRSAMIAGVSTECLAWITRLAGYDSFKECVSLSERLTEEQFDIEMVLRFLMLHDRSESGLRASLSDFPSKLDDWAIDLAADFAQQRAGLESVFKTTFNSLAAHGGENVFRKWDVGRSMFRGSFLNTPYEVLALGAGYHVARGNAPRQDYLKAAQELWQLLSQKPGFATGLATQDRFAKTIPLGRKIMANPPLPVSVDDL